MKLITKIVSILVIVYFNNLDKLYSQVHDFPKSSIIVTGGMDANIFHRASTDNNQVHFNSILGLGYSINPKNIIGINLCYERSDVYDPDYIFHESDFFSGLFFNRYLFRGTHINLNISLGRSNEIRKEISNGGTDATDYLKFKYGGGIGKTIFLKENMAINLDVMLNHKIYYVKEYRPDFGNMEYLNISFKADIIFYFKINNLKIYHYEKS